MSDIEQVADAADKMAPLVIRILSHLPIRRKREPTQQPPTQQPLSEDVAAIKELQESGLHVAYYKGPGIEVEAFEQARDVENERMAVNTLDTVSKIDPGLDWGKVDLDALNPEFLRRWTLETCNVSDETLQLLWAQLLTGELDSPGSVSNDTISIARDLNKARAEEFRLLCSAALYDLQGTPKIVVGCGNPGNDSLRPYGLSFDVLMRLAHHRLIVNGMNSLLNVNGVPKPIFLTRHQDKTWLMEPKTETTLENPSVPIRGILFTLAGEELFRAVERIPVPEYTKAMFEDLEKQGWNVRPVSMAS